MLRIARPMLLAVLLLAAALPAAAQEQRAFSQAELDQMLAPVALYPDPLLSQMLMAATYPLELVEAARWSKANPGLQGDAAVKAAAGEGWDPSVASLVAFPQVLAWMDENLQWTRAVGDAFLAQQPQVMDTVQGLRARAQQAGNLRSDGQVAVTRDGPTIVGVPADPQVVYVPYYDPYVVYGTWWWPAYPPYYWRPWRGYVARPGAVVAWTPGVRVTAGFFFGGFDWRRREARVVRRTVIVNRVPGAWQHDPGHRRAITYRDPVVQRRYAAPAPRAYAPPPAVQQERRDEFREERRVEERRGDERRNRRLEDQREHRGEPSRTPGGFTPGRGGFSPGPGGFSPGPGGMQPLQRERHEPGARVDGWRQSARAEVRPRAEAHRDIEARPAPRVERAQRAAPPPAEAARRRHGEHHPA